MIDDFITRLVKNRCQVLLRSCHTDGHADAGTERSGGRFDADRVTILRMARCQGTELTELHHIFLRETEAEQVKQGIQQHGAVSTGKNKAVTILPCRIGRIDVQIMCPHFIGHRCHTEWQSRVSGICLLDCIC